MDLTKLFSYIEKKEERLAEKFKKGFGYCQHEASIVEGKGVGAWENAARDRGKGSILEQRCRSKEGFKSIKKKVGKRKKNGRKEKEEKITGSNSSYGGKHKSLDVQGG